MGAASPAEVEHNNRRPNAGPPPATPDSNARISGSRDGSQVGATAFTQVPQRLLSKVIQPASRDIVDELPVPLVSIELGEPGPKHGEIPCGELADCVADVL